MTTPLTPSSYPNGIKKSGLNTITRAITKGIKVNIKYNF